jgi:hypothetical protein
MARTHPRNFGLPSRAQAHARWSVLEELGKGIASLLSWLLLIGLGFTALCSWLLRGALMVMSAVRGHFFRYRRQRWYRAQEQASVDIARVKNGTPTSQRHDRNIPPGFSGDVGV